MMNFHYSTKCLFLIHEKSIMKVVPNHLIYLNINFQMIWICSDQFMIISYKLKIHKLEFFHYWILFSQDCVIHGVHFLWTIYSCVSSLLSSSRIESYITAKKVDFRRRKQKILIKALLNAVYLISLTGACLRTSISYHALYTHCFYLGNVNG